MERIETGRERSETDKEIESREGGRTGAETWDQTARRIWKIHLFAEAKKQMTLSIATERG
jgi:hypothetical protein